MSWSFMEGRVGQELGWDIAVELVKWDGVYMHM